MAVGESSDDKTQSFIALTSGTLVSHYRMVKKIGAGGMGEVYLAEDTELDRKVALKFLPTHLCQDGDCRKRFKREAQAAAKLSHPNIIHVYEVSEYQGRPFFAMEHVEGRSLRDVNAEELDIDRIIGMAIQLCDGLNTAHAAGVTHRDIKPSNIIIDSSGRPKLLDFGLATVKGGERLTRTGSTLGTVGYMSPEQAEGKSVDGRSDLFSLGVVLYELIAGRPPFQRDTEAATLRAILYDAPQPLSRYRSGVSDDLQRIVSRLLERDPLHRYQSAADICADLKRLVAAISTAATAAQVGEESIVVVPFENLGGDPENEYFSDGLTEEIITALGKIGQVRVISRKSSMQLKDTDKDIRTIGREFGVMYILTGSVRRIGEDIRVNCELVEVSNERQLWSERYSGTMKDVFDIQEKIARSIAGALMVRLSVSEDKALANRGIQSPRAYDLYLRARQETERYTREGLDRAHELLTEAIRLEPNSATLHAALGYNYYNYVNTGHHQEKSIEAALQSLRRASELDPGSIDALRVHGAICFLTGEARKGVQLLEQVLEKSPDDTEALFWASIAYGFCGRTSAAVELAERLIQIEPFVTLNQVALACAYFINGEFGRALAEIEIAYDREPTHAVARCYRSQIQLYSGKTQEALESIRLAESQPTIGVLDRLILVQLYALQANREKVEQIMDEEFKATARRDIEYPWHIAVARTILGDYTEALDWLGIAVDNGFSVYRFLEELDPYLEPLRTDSRFRELVQQARVQALSNNQ
jgi:serine/threonine protein kinase/Flp pilus assembly protein TadD